MEENVVKPTHQSQNEESIFLESGFSNNTSKQVLEEKFPNNGESECALNQNTKIPFHVIESCVSQDVSQVLTEEIYQTLSDFCSDKLFQVIKSSSAFMKFSGRSKLTVEDFNRGLYANDEEMLLNSKLSSFIRLINRENTDISIQNATTDSVKFSESSKLTIDNFNQILHVNVRELRSKVLPIKKGTKRKRKNLKCSTEKDNLASNKVLISGNWLNGNPFSKDIGNLSPELQKYFNVVTMVLLGKNEKMCLKIIHDFKTNSSILNLVPYFVNFFSFHLNYLFHDFLRMSLFLRALHSLLSNSYLYLNQKVLLTELAGTVVKFLLSDMPFSSHVSDYLLLKDTAAYLLVQILNLSQSKELFLDTVYNLKCTLSDFQKSLECHYGALVALNSIGVPAIMLAIAPHINNYSKYLNSVYESDIEKRFNINMIQGQLIHSYYLLNCHCFKYELFDSYNFNVQHYRYFPFYYLEFLKDSKVFPFLSQSRFVDIYGDRLVQYFPLSNYISSNVNYSIKKLNLKHSLDGESCLREHSHFSIESPSPFVDIFKHIFNKNDKKCINHLNLRRRRFPLKSDLDEKTTSCKVCNVKRLCTKNRFKGSREQIFEIIPLKKPTIKFGKIKC